MSPLLGAFLVLAGVGTGVYGTLVGLGGGFVLIPLLLFLYPQDEWNRLEDSIRNLSPSNPQHRFFVRTLLQWSSDCQLDSQARISIPQDLQKFAGIENEVLILGVLERIEIWNPRTYEEYMNNQPATYETVAESVLKPNV